MHPDKTMRLGRGQSRPQVPADCSRGRDRPRPVIGAFTQTEVLVVLGVLALLMVMLLVPVLMKIKSKTNRVHCVGRLKNFGLACRIFAFDHTNAYPWQLSTNTGGSGEFAMVPAAVWRHFAILSNEIGTPVILWCPSDKEQTPARDWAAFTSNRHLSYFVGITARQEHPESILAGDRNLLLNDVAVSNTVATFFEITPSSNVNAAWDARGHQYAGNLGLGDGSVRQVDSAGLRAQFRDAAASGGPQKLVIP